MSFLKGVFSWKQMSHMRQPGICPTSVKLTIWELRCVRKTDGGPWIQIRCSYCPEFILKMECIPVMQPNHPSS
jgi:hypothetical protein